MIRNLVLLLAMIPTASFAELPVVDITFAINSQTTTGKLGSAAVPLQRELASQIAEALQARFGFLTWRTAEVLSVSGPPPLIQRFAITFRQVPAGEASEYRIGYESTLGGVALQPLAIGNPRPLYPALQPGKPLGNPNNKLRDDILQRVNDDLDTFREPLMKLFLSKIALSRKAPAVNTPNKMFVTDLPWKELKADRGSILFVDFNSKRPDNDLACDGDINLTNLQPTISGENGTVRARLLTFQYPLLERMLREGEWDPKIQTILDPSRVQTITIYMVHYESGSGESAPPLRSTVHH